MPESFISSMCWCDKLIRRKKMILFMSSFCYILCPLK
jgi:hypothetical protein